MRRALIIFAICFGFMALVFTTTSADDKPQVCPDPKVDVDIDADAIWYTAPAGYLVDAYCVKAGSYRQGDGPEYVNVDPDAATVVIRHSTGKDISHYSITLVNIPDTTVAPTTVPGATTPIETTVPVTTAPETATTASEAPTTTSQPPVSTSPEQVYPPVAPDPGPTAPPTIPTVTPELPKTGSDDGAIVWLAIALLVAGVALIHWSRRR